MRSLLNSDVSLHSVTPDCSGTAYLAKLSELREAKINSGDSGTGWMMNRGSDGHKYYFNVNTMEAGWQRADYMKKDYSLLTRDDIQVHDQGFVMSVVFSF